MAAGPFALTGTTMANRSMRTLLASGVLGMLLVMVCAAGPATTATPAPTSAASAPASAPATVRVAAIQFVSEFGQPEQNRQRLAPLIRQAAGQGAKIVVLPETAITGYMSHDLKKTWQTDGRKPSEGLEGVDPKDAAEAVPGPSTELFGKLAKELGIYLTVPLVEADASAHRYYNTIVLVDPSGQMLLHYRKLNPWPFAERSWAVPGDRGLQVVDTPYGRLGLLVCYDINFEPLCLSELKVDSLLYCIAWVDQPDSTWFTEKLPLIARENRLNIIGANWSVPRRPTWSGYGHSLILDHDGVARAHVKSDLRDEIIYADLPIHSQRPAQP